MKVIVIIMSVISVCAAYDQDHHFNDTDVKENFFHKIDEGILNTAKNIYKVFNPKRNLTESPKMNMLLTMHSGLTNIIQQNYEMYDEIKNICKVTTDSKNTSRYFDLSGLTATLYLVILRKFRDKTKNTQYVTQKRGNDNISGGFKDEKELTDFVNRFAAKLHTLSVNDLFKPSNESSDNETKRRLKYWRPEALGAEHHPFNNITRRIYRGDTAKANKFSFMASIYINGKFVCSGSMISLNLIITAASCLNFDQVKRGLVVAHIGSDDLMKGGLFIPLVQAYFHPLFNPTNLRNNLAIMRIKKTLYDPKKIKRIKLHKDDIRILPSDHKRIIVLGWGATDESRSFEPNRQLRTAKLDVYDLKQCIKIYSSQYVTENHFCAGFMTKGGGACNKDAGGPGIINGILVGVISFGPTVCGNPNEPTVFTKIGSYIDWISEIINQVERSPESQNTVQTIDRSFKKGRDTTYKTPNLKTDFKKNQADHRSARVDAISIVTDIINEVMLASGIHLGEGLYNELYEDFNDLYQNTLKQSIEEPDESIVDLNANYDKDSEYNDEPKFMSTKLYDTGTILPNDFITDTGTAKKAALRTTPKPSELRNTESYASTEVSDDEEYSDNYEDETGLNIDMSLTKKPHSTNISLPKINIPIKQETTDKWGLTKVMFAFSIQDNNKKQQNINPGSLSNNQNSPKRYDEHTTISSKKYTTRLSTTRKLAFNGLNTQNGRVSKSVYISYDDHDNRYKKNDRELNQREFKKESNLVTHIPKPDHWYLDRAQI